MYKTRSPSKLINLKRKLMLIEAELSVNKETSIRKVEDEVVSRIKNNPREFYRYAKSKTQVRNVIGPLKENDQNINSDESKIASILSKQYNSVFFCHSGEHF